ncbi:MAG: hypothetical protein ABFS45_25245, partial [Pseudomonadota bacterium]
WRRNHMLIYTPIQIAHTIGIMQDAAVDLERDVTIRSRFRKSALNRPAAYAHTLLKKRRKYSALKHYLGTGRGTF